MTAGIAHLVDDDEAIRDALSWLLHSRKIATRSWDSAESFLADYGPAMRGCLILDVRMHGMSGLELFDRLREMASSMPVIFLTGHGDVPLAVQAIKKGAFDFVEKPFHDQDLLDRIQRAIAFDAEQRGREAQRAQLRALFAGLTPREREVLDLVVEGLSNKAIANSLGLSAKTVEVHRAKVMEKMHARSISDLVKLAMQNQVA